MYELKKVSDLFYRSLGLFLAMQRLGLLVVLRLGGFSSSISGVTTHCYTRSEEDEQTYALRT
jgi:hypothetical protein